MNVVQCFSYLGHFLWTKLQDSHGFTIHGATHSQCLPIAARHRKTMGFI